MRLKMAKEKGKILFQVVLLVVLALAIITIPKVLPMDKVAAFFGTSRSSRNCMPVTSDMGHRACSIPIITYPVFLLLPLTSYSSERSIYEHFI